MTIRIAFPYKLRNGQRQSGLLRTGNGRVRAWTALKTKACTTENPRWRRVLITKVHDLEFFDTSSTIITPMSPPFESF